MTSRRPKSPRVSQRLGLPVRLWFVLALVVLLAILLSACDREARTPSTPPPEDSEWIKIAPGGETSCARGEPYVFWYRPGSKDRLLIYFQGGGLCWDAETCSPGSSYYLDKVTEQHNPTHQDGIFDLKNRKNPFRRYSMLYIPYCTGDIHWGNHVQVYKNPDGADLVIQHKGFINAGAALRYVYDQVASPKTIFVTGCSAGSVGSILHAAYIIENYPGASVVQLGDSLAFDYPQPPELQDTYRVQENFPSWIPAVSGMTTKRFRLVDFYIAIANYYPAYRFSQFSYSQDEIQDFFYQAFGGAPGSFAGALKAGMDEISTQAPNFRYYIVEGADHCSTALQRFYSINVAGVWLKDWVADLAQGKDVLSIPPAGSTWRLPSVVDAQSRTIDAGSSYRGSTGHTEWR